MSANSSAQILSVLTKNNEALQVKIALLIRLLSNRVFIEFKLWFGGKVIRNDAETDTWCLHAHICTSK